MYAYEWHTAEWWYDLLHSLRGQPVIDSEKHWIEDGSPPEHWPARHTYAAIWQGMLHHLCAWAHWVWAEPNWAGYEGSIYLRPAALHAAGEAMLDARRLARELAAVNMEPAKVAIIYSMNSIFWQADHPATVISVYKNLQFLGQAVTFISEGQLANDQRSPANAHIEWIILARARHVQAETVGGKSRTSCGNVRLSTKPVAKALPLNCNRRAFASRSDRRAATEICSPNWHGPSRQTAWSLLGCITWRISSGHVA